MAFHTIQPSSFRFLFSDVDEKCVVTQLPDRLLLEQCLYMKASSVARADDTGNAERTGPEMHDRKLTYAELSENRRGAAT